MVNEAFRASFNGSQFHANAVIDGIAPRFLEVVTSNNSDSYAKDNDVDLPEDQKSLSSS